MQVEPVTLLGRIVRLEPLEPRHTPALYDVTTPELIRFSPHPRPWTPETFAAFLEGMTRASDWSPFAIVHQERGTPIGVTCYLDIRPAHRGLEIGSTWITPAWQGTPVNPECKYLLMRHAFERLGAIRVQLKTDARNLQSQRAIEKLGAKREGVLRRHMILSDGHFRDTVMYSVVAEEWPAVKAGLEARLGYAL